MNETIGQCPEFELDTLFSLADSLEPGESTTVPAPSVCRVCDGEGVLLFAEGRVGGPCPACSCECCGQATATPPECKGCGIREDAMQVRRAADA